MRWHDVLRQQWRLSQRHSALSHAVGWHSYDHHLEEKTDACKRDFEEGEDCRLKSGHESTFVAGVADAVFREVEERLRKASVKAPTFQQWVYLPNTVAEALVGYDLSLGHYLDPSHRRVRSMHKNLLRWCDLPQSWSIEPGNEDHLHLQALVKNFRKSPASLPYLILHVCYCIHDYRRIGEELKGEDFCLKNPPLDSLLRTVIVSLRELSEKLAANGDPWDSLTLTYSRDWNPITPAETTQAQLDAMGSPERHGVTAFLDGEAIGNLPISTFADWRKAVADYLTCSFVNPPLAPAE